MHGVTRVSGLDKMPDSSHESTPGWSGSSPIQQQISSASGSSEGKGKAKETEDTAYRLFIMPLYTHT